MSPATNSVKNSPMDSGMPTLEMVTRIPRAAPGGAAVMSMEITSVNTDSVHERLPS
ncbi:MAG TPA: hypothetical protein VNH38_02620 [Candidatus Dormibacteraeota bacterium]|nr:hypothetical protein [Candidatus Dormibacteraeota bacterium]